MPIRMVDDPEEDNRQDDYRPSPGGGGGGGGLIGMLLPFLLGNPRLALAVLVIVGGYMMFKGGCNGAALNGEPQHSSLSTGGELDSSQYDKARIFASLAPGQNRLPESASLRQYCPTPLNQGHQGSCVAWSSAYAARSILQAQASGQAPNQLTFSPAYMYNDIKLGDDCQGSYIIRAMKHLREEGAAPFKDFAYNENDCQRQANGNVEQIATQYKIKGYDRLSMDGSSYNGELTDTDIDNIKQNLAQGGPVVIGMMVGGSFMEDMLGKKLWEPTRRDYQMDGFGGHAMCVIGYDDNVGGGAFQIMNSWGKEWGDNGFGWVRYKDFRYFVKEAYGLYSMGKANAVPSNILDVQFGLQTSQDMQEIGLNQRSSTLFATTSPMRKNTRFKINISNSQECYIYVFGEESDGSSYVLFPYTDKHSPFCAVTGTRVFPSKQSLMPDDIGNKDHFAVVIARKELDYKELNNKINRAAGSDYDSKLKEALRGRTPASLKFTSTSGKIGFQTDAKNTDALVGFVIEVDKQ